jgi:hypothetical protein
MASQPPTIAKWLLSHFGCSPNNQSVIGDLDERYRQGRSYLWYWKQALQAIVASFLNEVWEHKLLAIRALLIGWVIKVTWISIFARTYGRPPQRLFFYEGIDTSLLLFVIGVLTMMRSGWIIARTHRAHYRAMVLLFIAVEVIGGFSRMFTFYYWMLPMGKIIIAVVYHIGIIRIAPTMWESAAILVMSVLFGAGFCSRGEAPRVLRPASQ